MQDIFHLGDTGYRFCYIQHRFQCLADTPFRACLFCNIAESANQADLILHIIEHLGDVYLEYPLSTIPASSNKTLATNALSLQCASQGKVFLCKGLTMQCVSGVAFKKCLQLGCRVYGHTQELRGSVIAYQHLSILVHYGNTFSHGLEDGIEGIGPLCSQGGSLLDIGK